MAKLQSSSGRQLLAFIISISIGLIFLVGFMAPQITNFYTTDTTDWTDPAAVALWAVIIIAVIAGVVIVILKESKIL